MPLTTTQTQILGSHLAALSYALKPKHPSEKLAEFTPNEVLSSMVLELGPAATPLLRTVILENTIDPRHMDEDTLHCICDLCDKCTAELDNCICEETPPGLIFQGLFIKLLEKLLPILIEIFRDFFKGNNSTKRRPFKI